MYGKRRRDKTQVPVAPVLLLLSFLNYNSLNRGAIRRIPHSPSMAVAVSAACPPNLPGRVGLTFHFSRTSMSRTRAQTHAVQAAGRARGRTSGKTSRSNCTFHLCASCRQFFNQRGKANEFCDKIFAGFDAPPKTWTSCTRRCILRVS